ncbi:hypothetical protein [Myxococcus sp. RHSTA-1-4]|uniref:hypothetical protein n=1 Tax=Myxococcus sp. RHSTA-1-4 TaxID=2874601 RepID=UPI001CBE35C7|nr:hypothetical protein [Myxococcus sp. RHSTA-1-4]MBZ4416483.1 hypothetical protein [Myxococcus sp. RHSTA-1-4]
MRRLGSTLLAVSLFVGCGGTDTQPSSPESVERQQAPLTETDVDVAPECQGLLTFVNTAPFETLDAYLPSDVVTNLVTRRTALPFVSLEDVSSVRLVGESRLAELELGARTEGFIGPSCIGIMDELAISADDEAAMVALVNGISSTELHDILPYAWNGAVNLLNLRPFTSARAISNTAGIGVESLRDIRNAATLSRPLEQLINAVNALPQPDFGAKMARHFDRYDIVWSQGSYRLNYLECFGLDPNHLPYGASIRPNLADAAEVRTEVESSVNHANRRGQLSSSVIASGMANLDARIAGRSFKGCYFGYSNDPWSGNNVAFFVDTESGFSVLTETYWTE